VRPTTLLSTRFPRAASKARSSLWTTTTLSRSKRSPTTTTSPRDIALNFTEENPGANQEAEEFQLGAGEDVTADDLDVVYDDANGDYYVFLSAGDISSDIEDGDEYEVDFTVKNEELIDSDDEDDYWQTVNSTIGFEDAEISFDLNDDDEVEVENAENQSITGTTNVAPGTDIDVRVRSEDAETNFIKNSEDNAVTADGMFSSQFDFSEEGVNDTFTVRPVKPRPRPTTRPRLTVSSSSRSTMVPTVRTAKTVKTAKMVTTATSPTVRMVTTVTSPTATTAPTTAPTTVPTTAPTVTTPTVTTVATPKTARPASAPSSHSSPSSRLRSSRRGVTSNAPATHHTR